MKISSQEEYGLRCLMQLVQADGQASTLPEIAAAEGLSVPYVAKLMGVMRQAGLIESVRGRAGGYRLNKPPEEIRLGSLLLVLGEPLFDEPSYCQKHAGISESGTCVHQGGCSLKSLWGTLERWMRGTLDQITVADLMHSHGRIVDLLKERLAKAVFEEEAPQLIELTTLGS